MQQISQPAPHQQTAPNLPPFGYLLRRLWHHLGGRRRRQFVLLLTMMVFSAAAEVISLGLVLPFIAALAAPMEVLANPLVAGVASRFGIETADRLVIALTLAFSIAAVAAGLFRILVVWSNTRWTFATGADLSLEVYRRTLYQPYRVHVSRSSSEMISGITGKIGHTTLGVLLPLLVLTTSCILILAIAFTLLLIDPAVSGFAMIAFGGSYLLVTRVARRRLRRNSSRIAEEHTQVVKVLQEGLGGIRDVLLDGTQPVYCEIYKTADRRWRLAQGENVFIAQSPRFVIEALGMVLIAGLAFWLSRQAGGVAAALPVLGTLAVGAQRLLPTMQQGYAAWANISGSRSSFADTIALLDQDMPEDVPIDIDPLPFYDSVRFESVCFRYQPEGRDVLSNVDLTIPTGSRLGIVGATGSGKSTLVDLLMGLLEPTEGRILVDGKPLSGPRRLRWQRLLAHVPQSIFLADTTIAQNIALGVPPALINQQRVREAARKAQIADFIESRPEGYDAKVGERGVWLSGGQRQRLGIARALYRRARFLVLDEATSALDAETEDSVMSAIEALGADITIVLIAHRLTTVRRCDRILELDQGRIVAAGDYEQLIAGGGSFQSAARTR